MDGVSLSQTAPEEYKQVKEDMSCPIVTSTITNKSSENLRKVPPASQIYFFQFLWVPWITSFWFPLFERLWTGCKMVAKDSFSSNVKAENLGWVELGPSGFSFNLHGKSRQSSKMCSIVTLALNCGKDPRMPNLNRIYHQWSIYF